MWLIFLLLFVVCIFYRCYYPHMSKDSVSPCAVFKKNHYKQLCYSTNLNQRFWNAMYLYFTDQTDLYSQGVHPLSHPSNFHLLTNCPSETGSLDWRLQIMEILELLRKVEHCATPLLFGCSLPAVWSRMLCGAKMKLSIFRTLFQKLKIMLQKNLNMTSRKFFHWWPNKHQSSRQT